MCAKYNLTLEKRPEIFTSLNLFNSTLDTLTLSEIVLEKQRLGRTFNLISETSLILQKFQDRLCEGPQKPEKLTVSKIKYYEKFRPKIKILYQK